MTPRHTIAAAIALALIGAACNGDSNADSASSTVATTDVPTTTTAPATTPAPTTTLAATSTTAAPTTAAPTTKAPDPDDWVAIAQQLESARWRLYRRPNLDRIGRYCTVGSPCEQLLEAQLGDMISQGARVVDDAPYEVVDAVFVPNSTDGPLRKSLIVAIDVTLRSPSAGGRVVDANGETMYVLEYDPPPGETYTTRWNLARAGLDEPWRLLLDEGEIGT